MQASGPELRSTELQERWRELRAAGREAEELAADLDPELLWWRPEPDRWSVGECLDHLVRTGEAYLEVLDEAIDRGRRKGLTGEGPGRRTLVGRFVTWSMEPPPRLSIPAPEMILPRSPGAVRPSETDRGGEAGDEGPLPRFLALRSRLGERLEAAEGLDLGKIRLTSPFFSWIRFDLGSAFRIITAHERRHLWQARQVLEAEGFPGT